MNPGTTSRGRAFAALAAAGSIWGTGFVFGKWALDELSVGQIWVIATEGLPPINLSAFTWANVVVLGLLATTLTTFLWNWGLARVPASQAGVFINLEPVVGAILGVILLNDVLGSFAIVGGLLVIGSAVFVAAK